LLFDLFFTTRASFTTAHIEGFSGKKKIITTCRDQQTNLNQAAVFSGEADGQPKIQLTIL